MQYIKHQNLQQGLATVEFAIVLPLIILIALAVTELGRGLYQYNTLTKAVHDGVRYLSDKVLDESGILDLTMNDPNPSGNGLSLEENTKNLVIYGDVNGGATPVLPFDSPEDFTVTVTAIDVALPGDALIPGGGISPNHVRVSATYTFSPLFPALQNLGYQLIPEITVSATERALRI